MHTMPHGYSGGKNKSLSIATEKLEVTVEAGTGRLMDEEGKYTGFKISQALLNGLPANPNIKLVLLKSGILSRLGRMMRTELSDPSVTGSCSAYGRNEKERAVLLMMKK